jgi:hypothetical protein
MIEILLCWALLVLVPFALRSRLAVLAAIPAAASFAFPQGPLAAALAAPWALFCFALAATAARRFFKRRWNPIETIIDAGQGLIAVGGWGLVMSRAGMKPAGFEEPIVLLTAVHFTYTAFLAPYLIGLAGRRVGPWRTLLFSGVAVVTATPILALGFVLHAFALKLAAVLLIAAGLAVFAMDLVRIAADTPETGPRLLLGVASFSIFWGMALAILYQLGYVTIPAMTWSHGLLNGFGFATCGLVATRTWRT